MGLGSALSLSAHVPINESGRSEECGLHELKRERRYSGDSVAGSVLSTRILIFRPSIGVSKFNSVSQLVIAFLGRPQKRWHEYTSQIKCGKLE